MRASVSVRVIWCSVAKGLDGNDRRPLMVTRFRARSSGSVTLGGGVSRKRAAGSDQRDAVVSLVLDDIVDNYGHLQAGIRR